MGKSSICGDLFIAIVDYRRVCVCRYLYVCMYLCVYIYIIYIYTYIHTYIFIPTVTPVIPLFADKSKDIWDPIGGVKTKIKKNNETKEAKTNKN